MPGNEALLDYQGCMLFDGNCTLIPPVAARGTQGHVTAGAPDAGQGALRGVLAGWGVRRDHTAHGLLIHASTYLRQRSVADIAAASGLLPPSGFPLLFPDTPDPAVAIKYEAQGMVGGDFECSGTLIPGMCAISGLVVALPTCINSFAGTCTAVVVYSRGMDGCSEEIAVLKQTRLVPSNSFMSPTGEGGVRLIRKACCLLPECVCPLCNPPLVLSAPVGERSSLLPAVYTLEVEERGPVSAATSMPREMPATQAACREMPAFMATSLSHASGWADPEPLFRCPSVLQTGSYLLYDEGIIVGASEASSTSPTAAAPSAGGAIASNVTTDATWLGCILATMPAVMNGDILTTLDGIASPEACCRECRARAPNCTVWNGCFNSEEICRSVAAGDAL